MPTFPPLTPLDSKLAAAVAVLRDARHDGECSRIHYATRRVDTLLDRYPHRSLAEIDPELEARLRVSFKH